MERPPARPHVPPSAQRRPQLLGLSMAVLASLTYFGDHFTIMGRVSPEKASFEAMQRWGEWEGWRRASGVLGFWLAPDVVLSVQWV